MENLVVSAGKRFKLDKFSSQIKAISQNNIKKVLSVSANSDINSCECLSGSVTISGKIKLEVIYLSQDAMIESIISEADFIEKQKFAFELSNVCAKDILIVEDVNFSSNEIICSVTHNSEIFGIYNYNLPNFDESDSNIVADKTNFSSLNFSSFANDQFSVSEENETNLKDIQILKTNAVAVLDNISASVDKVVAEGRVVAEVIYQDGENISTLAKEFEFRQEIAAENSVPTMKVKAILSFKNAQTMIESADDKSNLVYNFDIIANCYLFEEKSLMLAKDLFLLNSEISSIYDHIETKNIDESLVLNESFMVYSDITQILDFDDLIGVFEPKVFLQKIETNNDKLLIYAKLSAYALYKDLQGINKIEVNKDVIFETNLKFDKEVYQAELYAQIASFKVKAGKELEIVFKTECYLDFVATAACEYIKSYEVVGEKSRDDDGIKVYVVRNNQTVFDIAKALNVRPNIISEQNQIEDCFESGQKVYVYSPINLA